MSFEVTMSLIALVVAVCSAVFNISWSIWFNRKQIEQARLAPNVSTCVTVQSRIAAKPSVLRFHGIDDEDLRRAGVDAEEFTYLLGSFEAASVYYDTCESAPTPFDSGSTRYHMLLTEATRKAWPLLKKFFSDDSPFVLKVEATIKQIATQGAIASPGMAAPNKQLQQTGAA